MSVEIMWLAYTVVMTGLLWVPYVLDRIVVRGMVRALMDRKAETGEDHSAWAKRAMAAHRNAVENLVIFAPAVLILHVSGVSTQITQTAAEIYFVARLAHYIIYSFGIPLLRTLSFGVAWGATMAIAASALHWI